MPIKIPAALRFVSFSLKKHAPVSAEIIVAPPSFIGNITADGTFFAATVAS